MGEYRVKLKAEKHFEHRGVKYQKGDTIEIQSADARTVVIVKHNDKEMYHPCIKRQFIEEHTTLMKLDVDKEPSREAPLIDLYCIV